MIEICLMLVCCENTGITVSRQRKAALCIVPLVPQLLVKKDPLFAHVDCQVLAQHKQAFVRKQLAIGNLDLEWNSLDVCRILTQIIQLGKQHHSGRVQHLETKVEEEAVVVVVQRLVQWDGDLQQRVQSRQNHCIRLLETKRMCQKKRQRIAMSIRKQHVRIVHVGRLARRFFLRRIEPVVFDRVLVPVQRTDTAHRAGLMFVLGQRAQRISINKLVHGLVQVAHLDILVDFPEELSAVLQQLLEYVAHFSVVA